MKITQLGATWCGPCVAAKQILPKILKDKNIEFEYIELGKGLEMRRQLDALPFDTSKIKGIPAFYQDGEFLFSGFKQDYFTNLKRQ